MHFTQTVMILIVKFPYGKSLFEMDLPSDRLLVVEPYKIEPCADEIKEVKKSLQNPIGTKRLRDLVSKDKKICIIVSDYTRAVSNLTMILPIISELGKAGCKTEKITICVANGLHQPASKSQVKESLGKSILEKAKIVSHDAEEENQLTYLGKTSLGTHVWLNRSLIESDFTIATGLIEPHFFAGYSGGRKSVLPGVAGKESIFENHSFAMIAHPNSRYGILDGNLIHEDMVEASKLVGLDYIVNVVAHRGRIVKAFSGNPYEAHEKGVKFLDGIVKVKVPVKADIAIVSNGGYPLDRDLYQAVKGMATGELVVRKGGVIIILSECIDGIGRGHESFYRIMAEAKTPDQVLEKIKREEPIKDQWEAQILARVLKIAKIIVVTKNVKHNLIEDMHMIPASSVEEALALSHKLTCEGSKIVAAPDGPYVIPY